MEDRDVLAQPASKFRNELRSLVRQRESTKLNGSKSQNVRHGLGHGENREHTVALDFARTIAIGIADRGVKRYASVPRDQYARTPIIPALGVSADRIGQVLNAGGVEAGVFCRIIHR